MPSSSWVSFSTISLPPNRSLFILSTDVDHEATTGGDPHAWHWNVLTVPFSTWTFPSEIGVLFTMTLAKGGSIQGESHHEQCTVNTVCRIVSRYHGNGQNQQGVIERTQELYRMCSNYLRSKLSWFYFCGCMWSPILNYIYIIIYIYKLY